ncbi:MAG: hypothetical protein COU72_00685 [Parcubacteria group bacterium CG10_big_fil_rev_8_21_14_0_10_41_35]|nr:MAG: hypothetical protein COU72_00685 [Parcubacteria group bacterium CG10_big_fil_rev_8_21_14_0_10_41_35]
MDLSLTLITINSEGPRAGQFRHPHEAETTKTIKSRFLLFAAFYPSKKANDELQSKPWFASWGWACQQETNKFISFLSSNYI